MKWLGSDLCYFWRICFFRNRLCNAGECNCNGLSGQIFHIPPAAGRCCSCCTDCNWLFSEESKQLQMSVRNWFRLWLHFLCSWAVLSFCVSTMILSYRQLETICRLAFTPGAAAGGLVGRGIMMAMQYGIARGLFSNESGLWALHRSQQRQHRQEIRSVRLWFPVPVHSGIPLLYVLMTGLVLVTSNYEKSGNRLMRTRSRMVVS